MDCGNARPILPGMNSQHGSDSLTQSPDARPAVLVTGAVRRIGAAIAKDLAAAGFPVAVHGRHAGDAESVAEAICASGGRAQAFGGDLADVAATQVLAADVSARMGPIGILVNNASVFEDDSVQGFDAALFDLHMAVHVRAPAQLAQAMAAQGSAGLIVNIIDQRVLRLNPRFFSYTLSKSAQWTATQTMAQALAPSIRVNAIGPGPTLQNSRQSADDFAAQIAGLPLKHGPALSEFAATILWMWRTPSLTGQMIALDGGQHLAWETPDVAGIAE